MNRKSQQDLMRAEFEAWVQDCGCDTDGAWSAWQAAWNRRPAGVAVRKIAIPGTRPLIEIARELLADPEFAQIMRSLKDRTVDGTKDSA